jgi:hypothetical protein
MEKRASARFFARVSRSRARLRIRGDARKRCNAALNTAAHRAAKLAPITRRVVLHASIDAL